MAERLKEEEEERSPRKLFKYIYTNIFLHFSGTVDCVLSSYTRTKRCHGLKINFIEKKKIHKSRYIYICQYTDLSFIHCIWHLLRLKFMWYPINCWLSMDELLWVFIQRNENSMNNLWKRYFIYRKYIHIHIYIYVYLTILCICYFLWFLLL